MSAWEPAPERITVAASTDAAGLIVTGAAVFADEAQAAAFADAVWGARGRALSSLGGRLLLRSFQAEGALQRLSLAREGIYVTFSTSLAAAEAEIVLDQAAALSRRIFLGEQAP
jgi:hypothetical protein